MTLVEVGGGIPSNIVAGIFGTLVGLISNQDTSVLIQWIGVRFVRIYVFTISNVRMYVIKSTIGLRISNEAEKLGTDKAEVGVMAYSIRD